jgi:hypothetical protein
MTMPTTADSPALSRSERLSRDVLHALMIDSQPWAELQANRREVVRTTLEELDPQDEFEGMLASQMAIAHSIFLGTTWLSLDRERPERDRTHYLRQATRLMTLYRQSFNTLRQWRRERARTNAGYGPRRHLAFSGKPERAGEPTEKREQGLPALHRTQCHRCAEQESAVRKSHGPVPRFTVEELPPLNFAIPQDHRRRLMATTGLALAQGP